MRRASKTASVDVRTVGSAESCANDITSKILAQSITLGHAEAGHLHHRRAISVAWALQRLESRIRLD